MKKIYIAPAYVAVELEMRSNAMLSASNAGGENIIPGGGEGYGLISGQGNSAGMFILRLKDWDERTAKEDQVNAVIAQVYARTADVKDAVVFAMSPGMIPGYGTGNALDVNLQDKTGGDFTQFYTYTQQYIAQLNQRPEVKRAYSSFAINYPQWMVDVDAAQCKRAGISPKEVLATLSGYYGGQYVSDFNRFPRVPDCIRKRFRRSVP